MPLGRKSIFLKFSLIDFIKSSKSASIWKFAKKSTHPYGLHTYYIRCKHRINVLYKNLENVLILQQN